MVEVLVKKSGQRRWAEFRFQVIGQLLAAPPEEHGELRRLLDALAARTWTHPTSGEPTKYAADTIERWYRKAVKVSSADLADVLMLLGDHWVRGKGEIAAFAKAKATLKSRMRFEVMNLFELPLRLTHPLDVIFCRNVFIYFRPDQIKTIVTGLLRLLAPDGYLVVGAHSSCMRWCMRGA